MIKKNGGTSDESNFCNNESDNEKRKKGGIEDYSQFRLKVLIRTLEL